MTPAIDGKKMNLQKIANDLLSRLSTRQRNVLPKRFGLKNGQRKTLEAIGDEYGITRERVRQIEAASLNKIRESASFGSTTAALDPIRKEIERRGGVWKEEDLLAEYSADPVTQNCIYFLLTLGAPFIRVSGEDDCHHHWCVDEAVSSKTREALRGFSNTLNETLLSEEEVIKKFGDHAALALSHPSGRDAVFSWLAISKLIRRNPFGEWGLAASPLVRPRGMRDYAYLVLKKHGSPLHFRETAKAIETMVGRPAHVQTVHNELIKDDRFILVGRGLYALSTWGYQPGIVRDIIASVLRARGPLTRDELVKSVQKERYVKENTILINLQNKGFFKKLSDGRFTVVS